MGFPTCTIWIWIFKTKSKFYTTIRASHFDWPRRFEDVKGTLNRSDNQYRRKLGKLNLLPKSVIIFRLFVRNMLNAVDT